VKANRLKDKAPVGQIQPPSEPFELVALDFIGPLPRHEDFAYILTMIDHFSGWCIAVPVIEQTAEVVVQCLLERLICQCGVPRRLLIDRGRQFEGTLMKSFCRLLKIQQLTTTSYNPQSNGKVERINGTPKSVLGTLISSPDTSAPWPQLLQPAVFSYNTSTSEATGMSPYYTLFGREAVTPGDQVITTAEQGEDTTIPTDALALLLHRNILDAHAFNRTLLDSKREAWAKEQAKLERSRTYALGDLVYLVNETGAVERPGYSLKPAAYVGPYRVVCNRVLRRTVYIGPTTRLLAPW
jgi:transposase InsO family protein